MGHPPRPRSRRRARLFVEDEQEHDYEDDWPAEFIRTLMALVLHCATLRKSMRRISWIVILCCLAATLLAQSELRQN